MILSMLKPIAGDVQLQDHAVVHQTVDGRCRGHEIFEDPLPFGKREIRREQDATPLVAMGQQTEEHLHLFAALLNIADVVDLCGAPHKLTN